MDTLTTCDGDLACGRPFVQGIKSGLAAPITGHMRLCRSALLAAIVLAVAPTAAHAATASVASGTLSYVATEGDANQLSVTVGGGDYTITDLAGHAIGVGAGCFATATTRSRSAPAPWPPP